MYPKRLRLGHTWIKYFESHASRLVKYFFLGPKATPMGGNVARQPGNIFDWESWIDTEPRPLGRNRLMGWRSLACLISSTIHTVPCRSDR